MGGKVRILTLEDNSSDFLLLERELRRADLDVALEWVQDKAGYLRALQHFVPDIVLADYSVPGFDGLAALALARQQHPDIPVIVVSGAIGEEAAVETLKAGATDYVLKDRLGRLAPAVSRALEESRQLTERKRVAEALRESEERFRLTLRASATGWWYWDFVQDNLEGDEKVKALLGLPPAAQLSFEIVQQQTVAEDRALLAERARALKAQPGDYEVEFRSIWPDGSRHWILAKGRSYARADGKPEHAMGIAMEITDRKEAEQALNAANRAKDEFLAVLSHELRTPLAPVLAAVSVIERKQHLTADLRDHLEVVRRNIELEARLIDDLLDLTRIARGKISLERKRVSISSVLARVIEVCRPDIEARGLHFSLDVEDPPQPVNADIARLQQVFWNLLKNSIKFTPEGGLVALRSFPRDGQVIVEVQDTGMGIEPEALTRVFAAFEQADQKVSRQFGGLGLGLAISKRLVEMHGGTISAFSEGKGQGATFRVALPRDTGPESEAAAASEHTAGAPRSASARILLVEDHGDTAFMMQELLESTGYQVHTAADAAQALEAAAGQEFDLLISDLGLPDRSGLELMQELRTRRLSLKGIALSGFGREEDVRKAKAAGFMQHLTKPVDFDLLLETIERVTGGGEELRASV